MQSDELEPMIIGGSPTYYGRLLTEGEELTEAIRELQDIMHLSISDADRVLHKINGHQCMGGDFIQVPQPLRIMFNLNSTNANALKLGRTILEVRTYCRTCHSLYALPYSGNGLDLQRYRIETITAMNVPRAAILLHSIV